MSSQLSNRFDAASDNKMYCRKISTVHPGINVYHSLPFSLSLYYAFQTEMQYTTDTIHSPCKEFVDEHPLLQNNLNRPFILICSFFYCMRQTHTHTSRFNSFSGWRRIKKSITKCMKHLGY